jgi:hypothetical protein
VVRSPELGKEALADQDLRGLAIAFHDLARPVHDPIAAPRANGRAFEWTSTIDVRLPSTWSGRGTFRLSSFSPLTQADLKSGRTVVVDDAAADPRTADRYHTAYEGSGFCSLIGVPLLVDLVAYLRQLVVYINELITNAVKHAHPNGRAGTITVSARVHGETAVIAVEDDGVGLPPGFDPAIGTGLGMTIVSTLAAQLEGCLEVRPSSGGTVELRLVVAYR